MTMSEFNELSTEAGYARCGLDEFDDILKVYAMGFLNKDDMVRLFLGAHGFVQSAG